MNPSESQSRLAEVVQTFQNYSSTANLLLLHLATPVEAETADCNFIRLNTVKIDSVFFIEKNGENGDAFLDAGGVSFHLGQNNLSKASDIRQFKNRM